MKKQAFEEKIEQWAIKSLLTLALACSKAKGCKMSTVSRLAHGDPGTISKIQRGEASITFRKWKDCMSWLKNPDNWPPEEKIPRLPPAPLGLRSLTSRRIRAAGRSASAPPTPSAE